MGAGVEGMGDITTGLHAIQHLWLWGKPHGSRGDRAEVGGAAVGVGETRQALGRRKTGHIRHQWERCFFTALTHCVLSCCTDSRDARDSQKDAL